jgi:hypothetical protein
LSREFLFAAETIGQVVWEKGVVPNVCLCNGISGNGYLLHSLYRYVKEISDKEDTQELMEKEYLWKARVYYFASVIVELKN